MKKNKTEIIFLGTSAHPSMPVAFCECRNCALARSKGKKNLRLRSSIMINSEILVDLGPDVQAASFMYKSSLSNIKCCLITHAHSDHFNASQIIARHPAYGTEINTRLKIIGSKKTIEIIKGMIKKELTIDIQSTAILGKILKIDFEEIEKNQEKKIGGYKIKAYAANHDLAIGSLLYKIETNNLKIFYGLDTADFFAEVWKELENEYFDILILDHTYGLGCQGKDHLSAESFIMHVNRMRKLGIIDGKTKVIASHLSHEGIMEFKKLNKYAKKNHYEIAFDGLKIRK